MVAEVTAPLFSVFGLPVTSTVTTMWAIMLVLVVLAWVARRGLALVPTGRYQAFVDLAAGSIIGMTDAALGREKARQYLPFLGTLFVFILAANYSGFIPGAGVVAGFHPPSSDLSFTAGLAVIVFFATHWAGLREHGLGYLKHFVRPLVFMLPLNIIEEFVRPLSLALRLYGNIYGEETVVATLLGIIPLAFPALIQSLGLIFGFVQAMIFTVLASVYIAGAVGEGH